MQTPTRLSDWPWVEVRVSCSMCPRSGAYRLARLAAQFGAEMDMVRLLAVLARDCPYWNSRTPRKYEARCGARYADADVAPPKLDKPSPYASAYKGPAATIGNSRENGVEAVFIDCAGPYCGNRKRLTYAELRLPDDVLLIDIPQHRRFRCGRCGSHQVSVAPEWRTSIDAKRKMREP